MLTFSEQQEIEDTLARVNEACELRIDRQSVCSLVDYADAIAQKLRQRADVILGLAGDVEELCFAMENAGKSVDVAEAAP